jgi:hypothetical protein
VPAFLRGYKQCIEASPLGYRLAKGAVWSLVGSLISRGLDVFWIPAQLRGKS